MIYGVTFGAFFYFYRKTIAVLRNVILSVTVILFFAGIVGCEKVANNTAVWVGTYTGSGTDSINKVIVSEVNNNTVKIQLLAHNDTTVYNFGTLQNGMVISPTNLNISENDSLYPYGGDYYSITGQGMLSGNTLTLYDTALNTVSLNPTIIFSFTGSK